MLAVQAAECRHLLPMADIPMEGAPELLAPPVRTWAIPMCLLVTSKHQQLGGVEERAPNPWLELLKTRVLRR